MGRPVFSQHCWIWSKTRSLKASTVFSLSSLSNFPSSLCRTQSPSCCNTNIRLAFVFFTAAQKKHLSHFAPFILLKWAFPHILPPLLSYSLLLLSTVCLHVNVRSCLCIFPSMPHTSSLSSPVASWEGCVGAEAAVFLNPPATQRGRIWGTNSSAHDTFESTEDPPTPPTSTSCKLRY